MKYKEGDVVCWLYKMGGAYFYFENYHIETYPFDYVVAVWRIKKLK